MPGAGRHRQIVRRRHDSGGCADTDGQGFVHHPGDADGGIVAGGEVRCAGNAGEHFAAGISPIFAFWERAWKAARAQAVVVETGPRTYLGGIASSMTTQLVETNFDRGIKRFTYLMLTFMLVMVPAVFFINALSKSPSQVADDDIVKLPSLAGKLEAKADPVSAFLRGQLDAEGPSSAGGLPSSHRRTARR